LKMKFNYDWKLAEGYPAKGIDYHGHTVFGTFICGGGSTMGYKLAGFNHLGGVEIDKKIAAIYKKNHSPAHLFNEDIRAFNKRKNLPTELYNLSLLDGSPPCSSFSMAGNRDKDWGKTKKFREGQAEQKLDDLVFEYVETINKLRPKVAILENVKGMLIGNAKAYVKKLCEQLTSYGYAPQVFLLNAASMGVPQRRERVFIISSRADLMLPKLNLKFSEKPIPFCEIDEGVLPSFEKYVVNCDAPYYKKCKQGNAISSVHPKGNRFNSIKLNPRIPAPTIASGGAYYHPTQARWLQKSEFLKIGTFPSDYDFIDEKPVYVIGMSVPPVMTAQISHQIYLQWLSKID